MTFADLPEAEQRIEAVAEATSWLRTPYHHAACKKGGGVDCAFLLIGVFSAPRVGLVDFFRPDHYPPDWAMHRDEERYLGWLDQYARPITGEPKPADVAVFKVGRCFSHAGIVTTWPLMIHASASDRIVSLIDARQCHRLLTNRDGTMRETMFYRLNCWPE